jgi:purine-nucleoside phosphorylase
MILMKPVFTLEEIDRSAEYIRRQSKIRPKLGILLGSGLGSLAESVEQPDIIPYDRIPYWSAVTVDGHAGRLHLGRLEGREVAVMQGRTHYYEGYEAAQTTFPIRVLGRLGVEILLITNAAGAVNPDLNPGDLMLITDHLNLIGLSGVHPLRGPNDPRLGPRFLDMTRPYDAQLCRRARDAAAGEGIPLREGVYVCVAGPSYETPAELRFLRTIGADAVGMSTVPETIVARHAGMRVLGISAVSNKANLDGTSVTAHEEILSATRRMVPELNRLVKALLRKNDF